MAPHTTQSSFIPKRGGARAQRRKPGRQIFFFSIVAYSFMFAALLAAGGSYLYKNYLQSLLRDEATTLNTEINTFSVSGLSQVSEFDLTLKRVKDRLDNTASVAAILAEIDSVIAQPIQVENMQIERVGDSHIVVTASINTRTFDGALFQRKILTNPDSLFTDVRIAEVVVEPATPGDGNNVLPTEQSVTFTTQLRADIDKLAYGRNETSS